MGMHVERESTIIHPDHQPTASLSAASHHPLTMKATLILVLIAIAAQTVVSLPGGHPHPHHEPRRARIERAGNGVGNGNKSGDGNFFAGFSENGIGSLNGVENRLDATFQADQVANEGDIHKNA
jgi:hypothetical protein